MTDDLRNRLVDVLIAETGQPPTSAALEVIVTVVRAIDSVDQNYGKAMARRPHGVPELTLSRYAFAAERALRLLRKNA